MMLLPLLKLLGAVLPIAVAIIILFFALRTGRAKRNFIFWSCLVGSLTGIFFYMQNEALIMIDLSQRIEWPFYMRHDEAKFLVYAAKNLALTIIGLPYLIYVIYLFQFHTDETGPRIKFSERWPFKYIKNPLKRVPDTGKPMQNPWMQEEQLDLEEPSEGIFTRSKNRISGAWTVVASKLPWFR